MIITQLSYCKLNACAISLPDGLVLHVLHTWVRGLLVNYIYYIPVPPPVPGGGRRESWGPSRVVKEIAPGPREPQAHKVEVQGALGPAGPGHGSPCGPPGSRRKRPRTPRHLGASGGPQGVPGPFPSRTRLEAFGGPRISWGPAALGAREPPGRPRDCAPRKGGGSCPVSKYVTMATPLNSRHRGGADRGQDPLGRPCPVFCSPFPLPSGG